LRSNNLFGLAASQHCFHYSHHYLRFTQVDAIATKRFDAQTGADREVQRILLELLNQMDGFDQSVNVKVIMATNRADTLDPALLRPGRLDRKIEFPNPDRRQKRMVLQVRN
jgi:26S proteasome regulatory subunit T3